MIPLSSQKNGLCVDNTEANLKGIDDTLAVAWRGVIQVATSQLGDIYSKIFNQESSMVSLPKGNFSPSLNLTSIVSHG